MIEHMYRYRAGRYLLGADYKELENSEIYFSDRDHLNDPMEGFKDIYWSGDEIIWRNFLKHYLLCLEHVCALSIVGGEQIVIEPSHIPVFKRIKDEPTPTRQDIHSEIQRLFFKSENLSTLPHELAKRQIPMRQNELLAYLKIIHPYALNAIFSNYEKRKLIPKTKLDLPTSAKMAKVDISELNATEKNISQSQLDLERHYAAINTVQTQVSLMQKFAGKIDGNIKANRWFIYSDFPKTYIKQIEKLIYPDWYVAAFSSRHDDPAMWGYYGDNHRGFCLKFKTKLVGDAPALNLHRMIGWGGSKEKSGPIHGYCNHPFQKIDYAEKYPEIDFFRSLGRLSLPALNETWFVDVDGRISSCSEGVHKNSDKWREKYWQNFSRSISTKLKAWEHEAEYRLTLSDGDVLDFREPASRKIKYSFDSLEGIIFGINATDSDKIKIIKIIEEKYPKKKRDCFKFYQAVYSTAKANIDATELSLLNLNFN